LHLGLRSRSIDGKLNLNGSTGAVERLLDPVGMGRISVCVCDTCCDSAGPPPCCEWLCLPNTAQHDTRTHAHVCMHTERERKKERKSERERKRESERERERERERDALAHARTHAHTCTQ